MVKYNDHDALLIIFKLFLKPRKHDLKKKLRFLQFSRFQTTRPKESQRPTRHITPCRQMPLGFRPGKIKHLFSSLKYRFFEDIDFPKKILIFNLTLHLHKSYFQDYHWGLQRIFFFYLYFIFCKKNFSATKQRSISATHTRTSTRSTTTLKSMILVMF